MTYWGKFRNRPHGMQHFRVSVSFDDCGWVVLNSMAMLALSRGCVVWWLVVCIPASRCLEAVSCISIKDHLARPYGGKLSLLSQFILVFFIYFREGLSDRLERRWRTEESAMGKITTKLQEGRHASRGGVKGHRKSCRFLRNSVTRRDARLDWGRVPSQKRSNPCKGLSWK